MSSHILLEDFSPSRYNIFFGVYCVKLGEFLQPILVHVIKDTYTILSYCPYNAKDLTLHQIQPKKCTTPPAWNNSIKIWYYTTLVKLYGSISAVSAATGYSVGATTNYVTLSKLPPSILDLVISKQITKNNGIFIYNRLLDSPFLPQILTVLPTITTNGERKKYLNSFVGKKEEVNNMMQTYSISTTYTSTYEEEKSTPSKIIISESKEEKSTLLQHEKIGCCESLLKSLRGLFHRFRKSTSTVEEYIPLKEIKIHLQSNKCVQERNTSLEEVKTYLQSNTFICVQEKNTSLQEG